MILSMTRKQTKADDITGAWGHKTLRGETGGKCLGRQEDGEGGRDYMSVTFIMTQE